MRALAKNIKGFNIIELLIVIVIVGILSAVAYPNFNDWRGEREVRGASVKIKNAIQAINSQVQRGMYGFVQVYLENNDNELVIVTKGMKMETLTNMVNDGASDWNNDPTSRCDTNTTGYWDHDGSIDDMLEVVEIRLEDITTSFQTGVAAVCFAKNSKWYSGAGNFLSFAGGEISVDSLFFICNRNDDFPRCFVDEATGIPNRDHDHLFLVEWSRFGNITMEKWNPPTEDWILQ